MHIFDITCTYSRCILFTCMYIGVPIAPPPLPVQVRHDQLMRQQEKMIQDMEKAVYRREAIVLRSGSITNPARACSLHLSFAACIIVHAACINYIVHATYMSTCT